jgi:hypothetical protein
VKKTIVMTLDKAKETKGCHRYGVSGGDTGVTTLYVRKNSLDGDAPQTVTVVITG